MRTIVLSLLLLVSTSGCGFFKKDGIKNKAVDVVLKPVKPMAVKHLECKTGDAVERDIGSRLEKLFKVKEPRYANKGLLSSLCTSSLRLVLPYLVDIGSSKLPASWKEDGCTLSKIGYSIGEMSDKLCGKIDSAGLGHPDVMVVSVPEVTHK